MNKYRVLVAMTYWCDVEVEAQSKAEAEATALDLFELNNARQGAGEVYDTEIIEDKA